ncbi:4Fe-4S binding protein [Poseidonibacter lekithochrous]|uniref:4Fe-4S binding protein n=1 Tax=Poseidonibacter TaxID=2321187 RepID=UPI001C0915EC|nr:MULTISPECIES: 4Fe-4S binding protein [Poseidonibacter]MBU3013208.1 4Fe-4S binding protein [Poseidonibacter lekithochrous]MDO6826504.1 4Fe-4S binding protein [Poseidonibacter sp. 1_MG-2023]
MQEFIYYNQKGLDFPISEEILVTTDINETKEKNFLISNTKEVESELNADEIDFYIKNSNDSVSAKIENVLKLYEIAATKYDFAQDISYEEEVSKQLLLVANSQEEYEAFTNEIQADDFELFSVKEEIIKEISGHIGNLSVIVDDEGKDVTLNVSQIVWFDAKQIGLNQSGTFDPNLSSVEEVVKTLKENINSYSYKKFTTYDHSICQYHERREEICSKCEEVCPTVAITKDDETKTLGFSQIDCHGCGGCVSVCPSGAIDYAPSNKESLFEMSKFYEETHPLIVPEKMNMSSLEVPLKENVLPFAIEGEKFLHEASFLTLLQISGSQVIFYSDFISKGSGDAIRIVNDIYQAKYGKDAILVAMTEEELIKALDEVSFIEGSQFNFNQDTLKKREIFSHRLQKIVGDEDLGEVKTGEHVHYGLVKVNEDKCTLCLVCVGACNVDALQADASDNTLRLNPSLCTSCGYCEVSCPETDCLTIERDVIKLEPTWFKESILAQDELFACVECGVEFATTKAVTKIANMMGPIFAHDPVKERSLYCCADCKPKIMMQNYYDQKNKGTA